MRRGALLVHGFAGKRDDMWPLAERLVGAGYVVSIPLLPGHEANRKELARTKRREWIDTVFKEYNALKDQCDKVMVIGHSMGGLLAITLCNKISENIKSMELESEDKKLNDLEPAALVIINTPIFYWNIPQIVKNTISNPSVFFVKYLTSGQDKPLRALKEFLLFLREGKLEVAKVKNPLMIIQTLDDDTVKPRSAQFIWRRLKGRPELHNISQGGHMVLESESSVEVCDMVLRFAKKYLK